MKYKKYYTNGVPVIIVAKGGIMNLGENFVMNNNINGNPIGCHDPCTFYVDKEAFLSIGKNVGISQSTIVCHCKITIGNNVNVGGGVKIYDTDFHSLDPAIRSSSKDREFKKNAPVLICDNAFIGAFSIILKGVTIGENSIIGAGSVVTKSIPSNQIWAGNPARFIREI